MRLQRRGWAIWSVVIGLFLVGPRLLCAAALVNDAWSDSTRTDPAAPTYSEYGADTDGDGNIESAWFVNGANVSVAPGHFVLNPPDSSQNWTTYFTPAATPVTLTNPGDFLKITWVFTPTGAVNVSNTSQTFPFCVVDTPTSARLTGDASPGAAAYTGYAMYTNFGQTLNRSSPFQLEARSAASSTLLNSSGDWNPLTSAGTKGNVGFTSNTQYTLVWTMTRGASNDLLIDVQMTGGADATLLNNSTDGEHLTFDDSAPNTFTFDTFNVRPAKSSTTATQFDFNAFKVETNTVQVSQPLPGDVNGDGVVNAADIQALGAALSNLNGYQGQPSVLDVNTDGVVNNLDMQALISKIATGSTGSGTVTAVPEPSAMLLWTVGGIGFVSAARRRTERCG